MASFFQILIWAYGENTVLNLIEVRKRKSLTLNPAALTHVFKIKGWAMRETIRAVSAMYIKSSNFLEIDYWLFSKHTQNMSVCKKCTAKFPTSYLLDMHSRIHENKSVPKYEMYVEKPICLHCGYIFKTVPELIEHQRSKH